MSVFVHCVWCLLSKLVTMTCTYSFVQPKGFLRAYLRHTFRIFAYCIQDLHYSYPKQISACLIFGGGSMFMCVSCLFSLISLCVPKGCDTAIVLITTYLQTAADLNVKRHFSFSVVFLTCGILSCPFGFNSRFFRSYCGQSASVFYSGTCDMGWAYMLAIVGTSLSAFCPILSHWRKGT
ncbi:hypothetical protein ACJMK2_011926 [Sinanodonta woodiana]|uniref:Uncharacterized protein n=1 Tax=Sinanodonta woodiana TaxID=1069815 RepID=A0ABD3V6J3_SINWO